MSKYASPVYIKLSEYIFYCRKKSVNVNIALVLLDKVQEFPNIYIEEIAFLANTTPSSVTKFCKELGYERFLDLKQDILPFYPLQTEMISDGLSAIEREKNRLNDIYQHIPYDKCLSIAHGILGAKRLLIICNDYSFNTSNMLRESLSSRDRMVYQLHRGSDIHLLEKFLTLTDMVLLINLTGEWLVKHPQLHPLLTEKNAVYFTANPDRGKMAELFNIVIDFSETPHFFSSNYYSNQVMTSTTYQIIQLVHSLKN